VNYQRIFLGLMMALLFFSTIWFVFIFQPVKNELNRYDLEVSQLKQDLFRARKVQISLSDLNKQLANSQQELADIKQKFIHRNELSKVAGILHEEAPQYNIKINEFSPQLDSYFENSNQAALKPISIVVNLEGSYKNIGRFLESMDRLNFFFIPQDIVLEKISPNSETISATVVNEIYMWNE
jgi:Tfp pilus assembly protein PilO